jgi:hypothetical protein
LLTFIVVLEFIVGGRKYFFEHGHVFIPIFIFCGDDFFNGGLRFTVLDGVTGARCNFKMFGDERWQKMWHRWVSMETKNVPWAVEQDNLLGWSPRWDPC